MQSDDFEIVRFISNVMQRLLHLMYWSLNHTFCGKTDKKVIGLQPFCEHTLLLYGYKMSLV